MVGTKAQKVSEDKLKKRKRESTDGAARTKRQRPEGKGKKANGILSSEGEAAQAGDKLDVLQTFDNGESWKLSKPIGGRMLDVDPILTEDEQYLILTYNTTLQVYSATNSLLVRRIPITVLEASASSGSKAATVTATRQSIVNPDYVWVASDDGIVRRVNWTIVTEEHEQFPTKSGTAHGLVLSPLAKDAEAVLVVESDKAGRLDVLAYVGVEKPKSDPKSLFSLKKGGSGLRLLEASQDGRVLAGALNDRLFLGIATVPFGTFEDLEYEFYSFDAPDIITCLDLRIDSKGLANGSTKKGQNRAPMADIIVGGARGGIYFYHDAINRSQTIGKGKPEKDVLQASKYHWHRKAVHAVKWSRDGNYMISGGSEHTLVTWQMDTSRKDFLPHLPGSIENIVVSANGASYVIHHDDNSVMVLSTAEMKPTAYVSGIQSATTTMSQSKDLLVQRTWSAPTGVQRPLPAAIRPTEPSKIHICVGNGRQATMTGDFSAPYLQSVDLESFSSFLKQPLARTHPTTINSTSKGAPIDEPLITHLSYSADGKWLASVDEWRPAERDADSVIPDQKDSLVRERREVYLKFWEVNDDESLALVSRVNTPHATDYPELVLDLVTNPSSPCFATLGGDGMVRLWRPKVRQQRDVSTQEGGSTWAWSCSQSIPIGDSVSQGAYMSVMYSGSSHPAQGALAFSEDGSTIFAAFGVYDEGVVCVIDAASGEIVKTLDGLWTGKIRSIKVLSPFIVVLSQELRVYDVVSDELRYGVEIPLEQETENLLQLSVDLASRTFAVALPTKDRSAIGIFHPEEPEPLLVRSLPHQIVSLMSSPDTSGFLIVDDAAQVWSVAEGSEPLSLAAVQPLEDLHLNGVDDETPNGHQILLQEDTEMAGDEDEDDNEEPGDVDMEDDGDDEGQAIVLGQYQLSEIFDATPAYAAPSIEDMFYKVTDLLSAKPLISN